MRLKIPQFEELLKNHYQSQNIFAKKFYNQRD